VAQQDDTRGAPVALPARPVHPRCTLPAAAC
jgi:hypothetical protein